MTEDFSSLASLHTALVDACNGYQEAIARATATEVKVILQRVKALHDKAHAEIHEALLARGFRPDDAGSFMSTVHKAVISVRSAVTGLGDGSLSSFASGEERIVADYDKAIEGNPEDKALIAMLEGQRARLEAAIGEMRATADLIPSRVGAGVRLAALPATEGVAACQVRRKAASRRWRRVRLARADWRSARSIDVNRS